MNRVELENLTDEQIQGFTPQEAERTSNLLVKSVKETEKRILQYEERIKRTEDRANYIILFTFIFSIFALLQNNLTNNEEYLKFYFIAVFPSLAISIIFNILVFVKSPSAIMKQVITPHDDDHSFTITLNQNYKEMYAGYLEILDPINNKKSLFLTWSSSFMFSHFILSVITFYLILFKFSLLGNPFFQLKVLVMSLLFAIFLKLRIYKSIRKQLTVSKDI
jgi:hypothetical protein